MRPKNGKKICGHCRIEKDVSEYCHDKSRVDGLSSFCKLCGKAYYKAHQKEILAKQGAYRKANLEKYAEYSRTQREQYRQKNGIPRATAMGRGYKLKWGQWFKANLGIDLNNYECTECGLWGNIEFHHINLKTKFFKIGSWLRGHAVTPKNIKILKKEIAKCQILCHSCHSKYHYANGDYSISPTNGGFREAT